MTETIERKPDAPRSPARRSLLPLVDLPENPMPSGAVCETISTADGVTLRCAYWPSLARQPRGTMCLFQGRSEFIEKYFEVIRDLRARGFAVATFDWRGQGGSSRLIRDGRLGHVGDFSHYGRDIDAFMREIALPECPPPFYALAHSMGAVILLGALGSRSGWFERMVGVAPMVQISHAGASAHALAMSLSSLGLGRRLVPGWSAEPVVLRPFAGNPVTHDPVRYSLAAAVAQREPALGIGGPTIGWVRTALSFTHRLRQPSFGQDWRMPTLFVLASEDRVVQTQASEDLARKMRATQTIVVQGAMHEVMQETDAFRDQFWAAFDAFIPGRKD